MLAAITWTVLHSLYPFPAGNLYLQLISYKDPAVYSAIFWIYSLMMFTTPFIIYSSVFSGIYTFAYRHGRTPKAVPLPLYPDPRSRRSEEHTSELSHVAISYAVFCLKKKKN